VRRRCGLSLKKYVLRPELRLCGRHVSHVTCDLLMKLLQSFEVLVQGTREVLQGRRVAAKKQSARCTSTSLCSMRVCVYTHQRSESKTQIEGRLPRFGSAALLHSAEGKGPGGGERSAEPVGSDAPQFFVRLSNPQSVCHDICMNAGTQMFEKKEHLLARERRDWQGSCARQLPLDLPRLPM
jgi:hypothetical protein